MTENYRGCIGYSFGPLRIAIMAPQKFRGRIIALLCPENSHVHWACIVPIGCAIGGTQRQNKDPMRI